MLNENHIAEPAVLVGHLKELSQVIWIIISSSAQWPAYLTDLMEVVGSTPTRKSENLFS